MSKKHAMMMLMMLVATLVAVNTSVLPQLAYFLDVGTPSTMFDLGSTVGSAVGDAFGGGIAEFAIVILFLA